MGHKSLDRGGQRLTPTAAASIGIFFAVMAFSVAV
jgi:hypothetical protein